MANITNFNYSLLPAEFHQEDIEYLEQCATDIEIGGRLTIEGIMRIGKRLNDARNKFGDNDKAFGQWRKDRLPWLEKQTAINFMRVQARFGSENLQYNFYTVEKIAPSILYALAAPSTPDTVIEKAIERAESGEKVTVDWVKRTKELEQAIEAANQTKEEWRKQYIKERDEKRELEGALREQAQLLEAVPVENAKLQEQLTQTKRELYEAYQSQKVVKVIPDDYESTKEAVANLVEQIATLKKKQNELVIRQVAEKLTDYQKELDELDERKTGMERYLAELTERINGFGSAEKELKLQLKIIEDARKALVMLAANMEMADSEIAATGALKYWQALAEMAGNCQLAILHLIGQSPQPPANALQRYSVADYQ